MSEYKPVTSRSETEISEYIVIEAHLSDGSIREVMVYRPKNHLLMNIRGENELVFLNRLDADGWETFLIETSNGKYDYDKNKPDIKIIVKWRGIMPRIQVPKTIETVLKWHFAPELPDDNEIDNSEKFIVQFLDGRFSICIVISDQNNEPIFCEIEEDGDLNNITYQQLYAWAKLPRSIK